MVKLCSRIQLDIDPKSTEAIRRRRCLRVGSDFSGIGVALSAVKTILGGDQVDCAFVCDSNEQCRQYLNTAHSPDIVYDDVIGRITSTMPETHMFVCTPPVRPFVKTHSMLPGVRDDSHSSRSEFLDVHLQKKAAGGHV